MRLTPLFLLAALLTIPACAKKEGPSCALPETLPRPMLEGPSSEEPRRLVPIGGYTLAVTWSPQYCAGRMTDPRNRLQCSGEAGNFGFTLHGLWPDGKGASWPRYCRPARLVPDKVIRANLCNTPSVQLIQHEWEKHGTCTDRDPAAFFAKSDPLFRALRYPDMAALRGKTLTAWGFQQAFAAANEGMKADQMRLYVKRDGWLEEVWLCLDTRLKRRTCPANAGGAAPTALVKVR